MLIVHVILAVLAVALLTLRPRSGATALALAAVAGCDVVLGAGVGSVVGIVAPLVAFLAAAITLGIAAELAAADGISARGERGPGSRAVGG